MSPQDFAKVERYVDMIRPHADSSDKRFACTGKSRADWHKLLNRPLFLQYINKSESSGVGLKAS